MLEETANPVSGIGQRTGAQKVIRTLTINQNWRRPPEMLTQIMGVPAEESPLRLQRLDRGHYRTLGISIALPSQTAAAEALAGRARSRHPELRLVAGGIPFKMSDGPAALPEHFDIVVSDHTVAKMLAEFQRSKRQLGRQGIPART